MQPAPSIPLSSYLNVIHSGKSFLPLYLKVASGPHLGSYNPLPFSIFHILCFMYDFYLLSMFVVHSMFFFFLSNSVVRESESHTLMDERHGHSAEKHVLGDNMVTTAR